MSQPAFTTDDKAFIRAILSNPAELTAWLVYADWLDEHDDPRAEFVRLMVRRGQVSNAEQEWADVEMRLRDLCRVLDPTWIAIFDRPTIENCAAAIKSRCPNQWEKLKGTDDPTVRHCSTCQKKVQYCRTLPEAQSHARQGHCVVIQLGVPRHPGDLTNSITSSAAGELLMRFITAQNGRSDQKAPRRRWWKFW